MFPSKCKTAIFFVSCLRVSVTPFRQSFFSCAKPLPICSQPKFTSQFRRRLHFFGILLTPIVGVRPYIRKSGVTDASPPCEGAAGPVAYIYRSNCPFRRETPTRKRRGSQAATTTTPLASQTQGDAVVFQEAHGVTQKTF